MKSAKQHVAIEAEIERARSSGEFGHAMVAVKKLLKTDHKRAQYLEMLVRAEEMIAKQQYDEAIALLGEAHEPDSPRGREEEAILSGLAEHGAGRGHLAWAHFNKLHRHRDKAATFSPREVTLFLRALAAYGSSLQSSDRSSDALDAYQEALYLCLRYYAKRPVDVFAVPFLQQILHELPRLLAERSPAEAVATCRSVLRQLRLPPALQRPLLVTLGTVLLTHTSDMLWTPPTGADSEWMPTDVLYDSVLALLLAEKHSDRLGGIPAQNALRLVDTIVLAFVARGSHVGDECVAAVERAFVHHTADPAFLWRQLALAFYAANDFPRADTAFSELLLLSPNDFLSALLHAKLCLNHLRQPARAIALATAAIHHMPPGSPLMEQARVLIGLAHLEWSTDVQLDFPLQEKHHHQAVHHLELAAESSNSAQTFYASALCAAFNRRLSEAFSAVSRALSLDPTHAPSLHLLSLLLSVRRDYTQSVAALSLAQSLSPSSVSLSLSAAKILCAAGEREKAYASLEKAFVIAGDNCAHSRYLHRIRVSHVSSLDVRSFASALPSADAQTISDGSNMSIPYERDIETGGKSLWLAAASIYVSFADYDEAERCLEEARRAQSPNEVGGCADLFCIEASIALGRNDRTYARLLFQRALAVDALHWQTLQKLGKLHLELGENELAEQDLRALISRDGLAYDAWQTLGLVYRAQNRIAEATECLLTAAELELLSPAIPFSVLPRAA